MTEARSTLLFGSCTTTSLAVNDRAVSFDLEELLPTILEECAFEGLTKEDYYSKVVDIHFKQCSFSDSVGKVDISSLGKDPSGTGQFLSMSRREVVEGVVAGLLKTNCTIEELCIPVIPFSHGRYMNCVGKLTEDGSREEPTVYDLLETIRHLLDKSIQISLKIRRFCVPTDVQIIGEFSDMDVFDEFLSHIPTDKLHHIIYSESGKLLITSDLLIWNSKFNDSLQQSDKFQTRENCKPIIFKNGRKLSCNKEQKVLEKAGFGQKGHEWTKLLKTECAKDNCTYEIEHTYVCSTSPDDDLEHTDADSNDDDEPSTIVDSGNDEDPKQNKLLDRKQPFNYWNLDTCQYRGEGTVIAIVDSGVDIYHPTFFDDPKKPQLENSKIVAAINFAKDKSGYFSSSDGHGTKCAGIACGSAYASYKDGKLLEFPSGVAPKARLVVCKVTSRDSIVRALKWLNKNCTSPGSNPKIDVLSYSLGSTQHKYSDRIQHEISKLVSAGVLVVCAASNDGHHYQQPIAYPAALGNVLCVGSHGAFGKPSDFSPVGQQLDFLAPGEDILLPSIVKGTRIDSGTSFATPALAGLICLILECIEKNCDDNFKNKIRQHCDIEENQPVFNHWVMKEILRNMATNPGIHLYDRGYGSLDPEPFFRDPTSFIKAALRM